jgi:hypothetical protein
MESGPHSIANRVANVNDVGEVLPPRGDGDGACRSREPGGRDDT